MKYLLIVVFIGVFPRCFAQDKTSDLQLINSAIKKSGEKEEKVKGIFYGFYKNHISKQILNDCIYDHSCSTFSKDVIENIGLIKGLLLTADRLTRCNRASLAEINSSRIDINGKAIDHWDHYETDH